MITRRTAIVVALRSVAAALLGALMPLRWLPETPKVRNLGEYQNWTIGYDFGAKGGSFCVMRAYGDGQLVFEQTGTAEKQIDLANFYKTLLTHPA